MARGIFEERFTLLDSWRLILRDFDYPQSCFNGKTSALLIWDDEDKWYFSRGGKQTLSWHSWSFDLVEKWVN